MRVSIKQRRRGSGLAGEDWWQFFDLRWRRGAYRILTEADGPDGVTWAGLLPERRVRFLDPQPSAPWALMGTDSPNRGSAIYGRESSTAPSAGETINVYRLSWPAGGIFAPTGRPERFKEYEPLPDAPEILLDVQRTATEDAQALLGFVHRWGILGVGIPEAEDFPADGVVLTGERLRDLARSIEVVHALQHRERTPVTWGDVAEVFQRRLREVHVQARRTPQGLLPSFHVRRLLDGLYLELWGVATQGKQLRRCQRCEHFFIRGREDQIFCTPRCARLWHVKRWKQRERAKRKQARARRARS